MTWPAHPLPIVTCATRGLAEFATLTCRACVEFELPQAAKKQQRVSIAGRIAVLMLHATVVLRFSCNRGRQESCKDRDIFTLPTDQFCSEWRLLGEVNTISSNSLS